MVLERIRELSMRTDILQGIVTRTNKALQEQLPLLIERKALLDRERGEIDDSAAGILGVKGALGTGEGVVFVEKALDELGKRRKGVENGIQQVDQAIGEIERESVSHEEVMRALGEFTDVFGELPPYRQRELVRLVVHRVELAPDSMKMALYGRVAAIGPVGEGNGVARSGISEWLPR